MRKFVFVFVAFTLVCFIAGCDKDGSDNLLGPFPTGAYRYTGYDTTGTAIVQGHLTLIVQDSTLITGEWHFDPIRNPQNIGPQVGSGKLSGGIDRERVWVELRPQYTDNNVSLDGTIEHGYYMGEWRWYSIVGITNYGTFEAVRY